MRWQRLLVQALAHVDGPVLLLVLAAGLARSLWLTVLLTAIAGAADLISAAYRRTIFADLCAGRDPGTVTGIFMAVVAGRPRLGDLRAGATAALLGPTVGWAGGGVAAAMVAVALAVTFPSLLRYTSRTGPARVA